MKNRSKFVIATLSTILLLGSVNVAAQAVSSPSFESSLLNTVAAKVLTAAEKKKLIRAEHEKLGKLTNNNPGAVYLLYVSDKALNGGSEFQYYVNFPTFKKYEDYEKWVSKLNGPIVVEPEGMPEGYAFIKGEIQNHLDNKPFQAQVKAEGKGKVVYSKKFEWTEAGKIKLEYTNGSDNIIFQMHTNYYPVKDSTTYKYKSVDSYSEEDKKKYAKTLRNQLYWTEKGISYEISTNPGNPLTKEELIALANTMIKK
ncbi:hypothetical protein [Paenibacillus sp. 481]|uniref:hypothetical protein n=1 Tax=Paenibacillus sp. 481 TaxID=2835869 RepID=UPI001E30C04B|nr:hypothetical protein [Paenibacillus sp. 481]UHA73344.1 hypothetical protein KIK04_22695 [Paenibacillus sp. 481]